MNYRRAESLRKDVIVANTPRRAMALMQGTICSFDDSAFALLQVEYSQSRSEAGELWAAAGKGTPGYRKCGWRLNACLINATATVWQIGQR